MEKFLIPAKEAYALFCYDPETEEKQARCYLSDHGVKQYRRGFYSKDVILEFYRKESEKCILVCSNCHKEIHHPSMDVDIVDNLQIDKRKLFESNRKQSTCRICGKTFDAVKGKIYCSKECRYKDRGYNTIPTREEVVEKYNELKSQRKVAEYFGLTKKIIMNILKKEK